MLAHVMATVSPQILGHAAKLLARSALERPTSSMLKLFTRTGLPPGEVERASSARPEPLPSAAIASPLSVRFDVDGLGGAPRGPLEGEGVVVKDSIDVAGAFTGLGLADGGDPATRDAVIVTRVRNAGGVLLGKAKMTELGMDGLGAAIHEGMPTNPRAPGYFAGGSSTGTAVAVASGLARYGVGGDGMGSIRIPAAFCGLVGLKPTRGRLPISGYASPAPSMDVPGPMARTAEDCARLWQVLAAEPVRPLAADVPGAIGVARQLDPARASRAVRLAFERALRAIGAHVVAVDVPGADRSTLLGTAIGTAEIARSPYARRPLSSAGALNVALGRSLSEPDRLALDVLRRRLHDAALRALERAPVIAMPTTGIPAPAISRALLAGAQDAPLLLAVALYTPFANVTGLPAIAVPSGVDDRGRPLSIMFVGAPGAETTLLRLALAIESTGLGAAPI